MFNEAIQNFEKALPLVRSGARSANSLQVEASLLQNIGAAYNELGRYFDAVIYHREAAALHGKTLLIQLYFTGPYMYYGIDAVCGKSLHE